MYICTSKVGVVMD